MISFENFHIVRVQQTCAGNAFSMSDRICTKNLKRVIFLISHAGTNDTDLTIALDEATDVAAGTHAAVAATFPIAVDINHGTTSDTLVRATDAASYVLDPATAGSAIVAIEWDPAKHTAGYDCIAVSGSGGHSSNTVTIIALGEAKYAQASLPTVITD
jgi:hypothetical protein